ncbi:hypothetical protein VD0004_g583 [Verticillium dahliae]|uniref:Uncharacterized protein n=1 Tax=Verticillium dahliae TaxID=27337 RepID=A0A444S420_VERDA|nr:hypothetical protein VD0004_g583 [Verticillium dahliae]PNH77044.1 hypothetical protein VD0001_g608 [Verticillium dahliae]RXG48128.1 hypothetical protein VDGE_30260 [Verticillium dahliae]
MVAVARAPRRPALDLAVYSPSDAKQTSNELSLTAHYAFTAGITLPMKHVRAPRPVREDACRVRCSILDSRHSTAAGTAGGRRPSPPSAARGVPLRSRSSASLERSRTCPQRLVTKLVIRRQSHRTVGSASIARLISTCLANLDALDSERWHCRNASNGDQLYGESLKRLYLFSEAEAETQQISPSAGPYALDPADMLCKKALTL